MLQLHLALNLIDAWPLQLCLQISKRLAQVYRLRVLSLVQKLRRLPATNTGGGPIWEILHSGAHFARKSLAFLGAASGAQNQGEAVRKGGGQAEDK